MTSSSDVISDTGRIMSAQRCVVVGIMLTTLGGCVALSDGPERAFTVDDQVTFVRANQPSMSVPIPGGKNEAQDELARNNFITERMYLMDLEFNPYFARLTAQNQAGNLAGDTAIVVTTFLSTVLASNATKTALSAAATGIGTLKTDIDQDVLLSHTIQLLLQTMLASRSAVGDRITANLACPIAKYTVWQALSDLEDYYRAGTLSGALEALAASTGNNSQQQQDLKNGVNKDGQQVPTAKSLTSRGAPLRVLATPPASTSGPPACPSAT